jgi:predicted Rossmann fold flavoprotein
MNMYDIAIIGGGAAGMMAAITASKSGKKVVLIEKNAVLGRKILATGNGRCNLTNRNATLDHYHGATTDFIKVVLDQFGSEQTIKYFKNIGLILKEEDKGRIFPRTNQASSVVNLLKHKLLEVKVELLLDTEVKEIRKNNLDGFSLTFSSGEAIESKKLIITTGGKASYFLGSSGDGYFFATNFGHKVMPISASLVPVETIEKWPKDVQGVKVEAKVALFVDDSLVSERTGDLLFTHYGLSGPSVMSQSRAIGRIFEKHKIEFRIDLFPEIQAKELDNIVAASFEKNGKQNVKNALIGILPESMIGLILKLAKIDPTKKAAEISRIARLEAVKLMKDLVCTVSTLRSIKEAQVTSGGVFASEINPDTMESRIVKNLYFAGEVIDVDGDSGGYNLQWAWSSGFVAGKNCSE